METPDLVPLIEQLDDNVDDLEEALDSLLKGKLSEITGKLPLLDKAHLYVLVTYAIESILFSYLRLNGVNGKEHPVFRELIRVKQYFEKIKVAQSAGIAPVKKLDRAAASRFIKHALAGNDKSDAKFVQQQARTKAGSHTRFDELSQKLKADDRQYPESRNAALNGKTISDTPNSGIPKRQSENTTGEISVEGAATVSNARKARGEKRKSPRDGPEVVSDTNAPINGQKQLRKRRKKERKKQRVLENN